LPKPVVVEVHPVQYGFGAVFSDGRFLCNAPGFALVFKRDLSQFVQFAEKHLNALLGLSGKCAVTGKGGKIEVEGFFKLLAIGLFVGFF